MKEIIKILVEDHRKVDEKIVDTKRLMTLDPAESFDQIAKNLAFFKDFTFKGHHQRESEVLYMWMRTQNANSDTAVMDRIKNEHVLLEKLGEKIHQAVLHHLAKTPQESSVQILSELNDFIVMYIEHIEKEENFIFMIAEGLLLTPAEKAEMLKRMKDTF